MVFVSPYFDHDAFMHHTMHVLDSPEYAVVNDVEGYKNSQEAETRNLLMRGDRRLQRDSEHWRKVVKSIVGSKPNYWGEKW